MARLSISLLGSFQVTLDGVPVTALESDKVRALLAYLAVEADRPHRRDVLTGLLWAERPEHAARANLRRALYNLRQGIGDRMATPSFLSITRETVQFNAASDYWLDVVDFTELTEPALSAAKDLPWPARDGPGSPDLSALHKAAALYRGRFLEGFSIGDSPAFEEWALFVRERLDQQALAAFHLLATCHEERGEYAQAVRYARRQVALEPWFEEAHRQLMRALALDGQRGAALRQYAECERILQEELGVLPQEETIEVYEAVKLGLEHIETGALRTMRGYELRERIGEGAFGVVYRGYQPAVDRQVAIKVLSPRRANYPEFVRRFESEARLVARLEHPHIVPLYDYWRQSDGAYLVMRWLRGGDLRTSLQGGPWDGQDAARLLNQVAGALMTAHRQGIVHRDVKPENILLDEEGNAYLSDFGIAKDALHATGMTGTGDLVGTSGYVSPEQVRGEPLTPQSDIYSLGVVMYETLTAEHPFSGATPAEHLTEPLPALGERRPDLPGALDDVLRQATAKEPTERYADAPTFAGAFREVLAGRAKVAVPLERVVPEPGPRHNLPAQAMPFVGRERELAELEQLLAESDVRLVTVLGSGGMGKTRLALQVAERQLEQYLDGVHLVSLASLRAVEAIVPAIAQALDFTFSTGVGGQRPATGEHTPRRQLLNYLRGKAMLLLVDNWEHLLDGVDVAAEILQAAPGVKILAASRARLNVQGEQLFYVEGMDRPEEREGEPQEIVEYDAVRLFLEGARRVRPGFDLAAEDAGHVVHICRLVGGMPLGVLLASAWMDMLTPAEIAGEIERGLDFLESDLRDLPERQRSMRALFDHSWNLLAEGEREAFAGVSVFLGGFTREAAQEVTGASLRELRSLVDKSLLHHVPVPSTVLRTGGRYQVHEFVRQYAAEKLARTADGGAAIRDRHCAHYAAALERWEVDLKSARQQQALAEMDVDIDNARAAWDWAAERGYAGQLDRAMESLGLFYDWRYRHPEGEAAFQEAADGLSAIVSGSATVSANARRVLARALSWQGVFLESERNRQLQEQSLALLAHPDLDESSTRLERATALYRQGGILFYMEREQAVHILEQSLALYRAVGDRWGMAHVLHGLGFAAVQLGGYRGAEPLIEETLAIHRSMGDPRGIAQSLAYWSTIELMRGNLEEAIRLQDEVIAALREIGDQAGVTMLLLYSSIALLYLGRYDEARLRLKEALPIRQRLGISSAYFYMMLGWVELHLGHYERARIEVEQGLVMHRKENDQWGTGGSLAALSGTLLAQGELVQAQQTLCESVALLRRVKQPRELIRSLATLGQVECQLGNIERARPCFCEALRTATAVGMDTLVAQTLARIAVFLLDQGEDERAVEMYALAMRDPSVANSRWFEDTAGQTIAAAAEGLSPERVAAARERGSARDLQATAEELADELGDG